MATNFRSRFRPPAAEPAAEIAWLLRAAFATDSPDLPSGARAAEVADLARRLGLDAPIGARLRAQETSPLPPGLVESFRQAHARTAILTAMHEKSARRIAKTAARLSIPLVFLKGFALYLAGRDQGGGRAIGDLDLLAPEPAAGALHAELRREGWRSEVGPGNEHHLATLLSPEGGSVDLHFCLRGLALAGSSWATWEDLAERGALIKVDGYPADCYRLESNAHTAHLLVHGLCHHVWRPHAYPLLRLLGDLRVLLPDGDSWASFLDEFRPILLRSVKAAELDALRRLTLELGAGRVPDLTSSSPSAEAVLLRHFLGGYLDESYGRKLRLRHALDRLRDAVRQGRLGSYLARRIGTERVN